MNQNQDEIVTIVQKAIAGAGAHVAPENLLEGLDWEAAGARPNGVPFSILQILNHVIYWQEWMVQWLDGEDPSLPDHAAGSWPGDEKPASGDAWERVVKRFLDGQKELQERCTEGDLLKRTGEGRSRLGTLITLALHNSYHLGQIVTTRRILGSWPPPSGGLTW